MDNAATEDNALRMANYGTPGPTIQRLLDFQRLYIATQEDGKSWQASPIRLPLESLREWPVADACIALATADPLYHEGAKFVRMLRSVGKAPAFMEVEGAPHMIMNLGGVMKKGRELLCWLIAYMADRFGVPLEGAQP
jgi:acetyl esterase/lipase